MEEKALRFKPGLLSYQKGKGMPAGVNKPQTVQRET